MSSFALSRKPKPAAPIAWSLTIAVSLVALYVWGSSLDWQFSGLSLYALFPLLGLLAWSIMWSHYMAGFMQRTFLKGTDLTSFFRWTGYAVLTLILLHPGLLAFQRFRDGFGLPPGSETSYVAPGLGWVVVLGMLCLLVFLSYELHRWYGKRSWWKYVVYAGDAAMFGIFYHGLRLGTQLHVAWFRYVWWFYGICLAGALIYAYFFSGKRRAGNASE